MSTSNAVTRSQTAKNREPRKNSNPPKSPPVPKKQSEIFCVKQINLSTTTIRMPGPEFRWITTPGHLFKDIDDANQWARKLVDQHCHSWNGEKVEVEQVAVDDPDGDGKEGRITHKLVSKTGEVELEVRGYSKMEVEHSDE